MKVELLEVSLKKNNSWDIQRDQMQGESGFTRSIVDELHTSYNQEDQMEVESGVT